MSGLNQDFSVAALDKFLVYLGDKGLMPRPTVASRRASCNKMLGVLSEEEKRDLRTVDLGEVSARFGNLEGRNYTPDSLKTYKSRTSKALEDFFRYMDEPATFRAKSYARAAPSSRARVGSGAKDPTPDSQDAAESRTDVRSVDHLTVPVPIREGLIVRISGLPFDLTQQEASKIANVVKAMASLQE
jgi:hypothetical protein